VKFKVVGGLDRGVDQKVYWFCYCSTGSFIGATPGPYPNSITTLGEPRLHIIWAWPAYWIRSCIIYASGRLATPRSD
jgi:hypothetical protein